MLNKSSKSSGIHTPEREAAKVRGFFMHKTETETGAEGFVGGLPAFSDDAARVLVYAEEVGSVTYSQALRHLDMPYGDAGRAFDELIAAGMLRRQGAELLPVGGAS